MLREKQTVLKIEKLECAAWQASSYERWYDRRSIVCVIFFSSVLITLTEFECVAKQR